MPTNRLDLSKLPAGAGDCDDAGLESGCDKIGLWHFRVIGKSDLSKGLIVADMANSLAAINYYSAVRYRLGRHLSPTGFQLLIIQF